ncbi:hypothetical protein IWW36_003171 [Coemansia brasiliensis]|uniref:Uncharacterized protein n=1 Tax=Coemansia brasiliensis TaxID=2650707 RepID=A0A9W8I6U1_9FUNG|nr:hypothetical protein IWW36_003171 [Coemansia brasiliensis]
MSSNKRVAVSDETNSKRVRRTPVAAHADDCQDTECTGCAAGAIVLDQEVLDLSANQLVAMAEQEASEGTDRAVVTKLYEAALEKFDGKNQLPHAWALLSFAEYIDFDEYAIQAVAIADKSVNDDNQTQVLLLKGRANVLKVCLNQSNWADLDNADTDDEDEPTEQKVAGDKLLLQGFDEITRSLQNANSQMVLNTVTAFLARYDKRPLISSLRMQIMDTAMSIAYMTLQWDTGSSEGTPEDSDLALAACKSTLYWALAASACLVSEGEIEDRVRPAVQYLARHTNNADVCKLYAQIMLVLSGLLSDDDAALEAFDSAENALKQVLKINPSDSDARSQLEDLGISI